MQRDKPAYYPVCLDLRRRRTLVVGGGKVAARKAAALRAAGAEVTVVAPLIDPKLKDDASLDIHERPFRTTDLHNITLVIAATDDEVLNRTIARDAQDLGVLVNVVDCPALCSFVLPATLKHGHVQVSVSTAGSSPTLARKLRDLVAETVGPEYGQLASILAELRARVIEALPDHQQRAELFERLTDTHFLSLIRDGKTDQARTEMLELVKNAGA